MKEQVADVPPWVAPADAQTVALSGQVETVAEEKKVPKARVATDKKFQDTTGEPIEPPALKQTSKWRLVRMIAGAASKWQTASKKDKGGS